MPVQFVKRYGFLMSFLILMGIGIGFYIRPLLAHKPSLSYLPPQTIWAKAAAAVKSGGFVETLRYTNHIQSKPALLQTWLQSLDMPWNFSSTHYLNIYDQTPQMWRISQTGARSKLLLDTSRNHQTVTVVNYAAHQVASGKVPSVDASWQPFGPLWAVGDHSSWAGWHVSENIVRISGVPSYAVTYRPQQKNSLIGSVTYWFQGQDFVPMGMKITTARNKVAYQVKAVVFSANSPGNKSVAAPPAGGFVSVPPATYRQQILRLIMPVRHGHKKGGPKTLGPFHRTAFHQKGAVKMAWYGDGWSQIIWARLPANSKRAQELLQWAYPLPQEKSAKVLESSIGTAVLVSHGKYDWIGCGAYTPQALYQWMEKDIDRSRPHRSR
ncbi:MAG: hypothetical protein OWS74_08275 [Firmicutes bacterium]|nr:hypothetical protein [Bacillota bacterium]